MSVSEEYHLKPLVVIYQAQASAPISEEEKEALEYLEKSISEEDTLIAYNSKGDALYELKRYDEAQASWNEAINILKKTRNHAGEIAVSLIMLAHLTYERDNSSFDAVEELLDKAWEYINSDDGRAET